ncbi:MAG: hypothetical protein ABIO70_04120 [Pseudomonadota bacterium]
MPSGFRPWPVALALALLGCPPSAGDDTEAPDSDDTGAHSAGIVAEPVLHVDDGPGDLDLTADGLLLIVTRYGGDVRSWSPQSGAEDVVQHAIPDLEGIFRAADDRLWAASSDGQVEGSVGWIEHNDYEEITDQADDGTLMRGLDDVVLADDGTLIAVDDIMEGLFLTDPGSGSTAFVPLAIDYPQALLLHDGALLVAGNDGVYRVSLPDGGATRLDERAGRGLALWGSTILASNTTDGIYAVGGAIAGGGEIPSPRNLLAVGDTLYVSDAAGYDLYAMDLSGWVP